MYLPSVHLRHGKGCRGAGAGKNNPDLVTGVLTPVQDQQLTRLWFEKTYTNSHTGAGQEAFNFCQMDQISIFKIARPSQFVEIGCGKL